MTVVMKKQVFASFTILSAFVVCAQEKLGISNSNYSSTNSIFLNPSSSVDSRAYQQFNLVGANVYAMNNLGYLPKFSLWGAVKNEGLDNFKISDLQLKKFLLAVASVEGPAFVISKRNYGAGFFIRGRTVAELKRIPFELTNYLLNPDTNQALKYPVDVNLQNVRLSNMTWVEYGLNFGMMVKKEKTNLLSIGGNIKYITGINIAYGNIQQLKGRIEDRRIVVDNLQRKLRFNEFGWNTGRGVGVDIGLTYKKMLAVIDRYYANSQLSNCKYVDYKFKFGISLRDVGAVRFKKNTSVTDIKTSGQFNTDTTNNNINFESDLKNNFNVPIKNSPILSSLPTSLSMQFDYNFGYHFYLNTTLVKNIIPNSFTGVQGNNLVSVCPRYEFKNFELAAPLSFQKFIYPQLGFAFRVRTFVLGVDNVFPLIIKKNTYGLNLYFNLGFSLFSNQSCRKRIRKVDDCPPFSIFKRKVKEKKMSKPAKKKSFTKKLKRK